MNKKSKTFFAKARSWISENDLHGPHAFLRFVSLVFVQRLNDVSDEFVFKGGNLLWLYIKTPRATTDIDFATRSLANHDEVQKKLEEVCRRSEDDVRFSIQSFEKIEQEGNRGAAVIVHYVTSQGQENTFSLDIVYAIPSLVTQIESPIEKEETITVATLENVIVDKLSACQRFKGGNSRMKDFDDLWRISQFRPDLIDWPSLNRVIEQREVAPELDLNWINPQMFKFWEAHTKRNKGLPTSLQQLLVTVNEWLTSGLGQVEEI